MKTKFNLFIFATLVISFTGFAQGSKTLQSNILFQRLANCTAGRGVCSVKSYTLSYNTFAINASTASAAVNNVPGGGTIIVDLVSANEAVIWISKDLTLTGLSSDDFRTLEIANIIYENENIELIGGEYPKVEQGGYFTYSVPYKTF